jgi:50S ribosomal subunit-associated GTPase HflX
VFTDKTTFSYARSPVVTANGSLAQFLSQRCCIASGSRQVELFANRLLFSSSAALDQFLAKLDCLAVSVETHGGRVVGRHIQRRSVSHGGAREMSFPFSRRTLLSPGKAHEAADACRAARVGVVVFVNPLTEHQRDVLRDMFGCPLISGSDLIVHCG